jgi:hypothetical protein
MPRLFLRVSILLLVLGLSASARADWTLNGSLVGGRGAAYASAIVSDGAGGVIVAWSELRASDYDVYARRIDANGNMLWTSDGVAVCTAPLQQQEVQMVSDGAGGAIIAWRDFRAAQDDVYAQRVSSTGAMMWAANGVAICTNVSTQAGVGMVSDGAAGAIITWQDARAGNWDIYARRINAAGNPQWNADGNVVCALISSQVGPVPIADGSGGVIIGWNDFRNTDIDIYAQRLNSSGAAQWTANGVSIFGPPGNEGALAGVSDGAGGALFTCYSQVTPPPLQQMMGTVVFKDIYAQRVNSAGAKLWAGGVSVCTANDEQGSPRIIGDGTGGAIIAWEDFRNGTDLNIYAQRVTAFGITQWTYNGVALCAANGNQTGIELGSDGASGAIAAWVDQRGVSSYDLFARRILSSGQTIWANDGSEICTSNQAGKPFGVADGTGGAIFAWSDSRGGLPLMYAQRIEYRYGDWGRPEPGIKPAIDTPSDQGGKVIVRWLASQRDLYYQPDVSHYSVWRSTDALAFAAYENNARKSAVGDPRSVARDHAGSVMWSEQTPSGPVYWEWVGNLDASYQATYSYNAPTRSDSIAGNPATHYFKVLGHGVLPHIWESGSVSARSVDNLAPASPLMLAIRASGTNAVLTWNAVDVPDFDHYTLYRASFNGVRAVAGNFLNFESLTNYTDVGAAPANYHYVVTATDIHGNESDPSNEVSLSGATGIGNTPPITTLTLAPNFPNPFSAKTELNIGVPARGDASVELYDIAGRLVLARKLGTLESGWQNVTLDARTGEGATIASGVYFCRIRVNAEAVTRKIVISH